MTVHIVLDVHGMEMRLPDVDALLELIVEGAYDEHLEDILAASHGRKRELRGSRAPRHPYGLVRVQ